MDGFLAKYDAAELRIAAEFLSNWLPFLSDGLCKSCAHTLSDRIRSLDTGENFVAPVPSIMDSNRCKEDQGNCSTHSIESGNSKVENNDNADTHSLGSWKDEVDGLPEHAAEASSNSEKFKSPASPASPRVRKSWADMAQEDELEEEENEVTNSLVDVNDSSGEGTSLTAVEPKVALSREQREYIRFYSVERIKDFISLERVNGKFVNVLAGLELHKGVFSAAEQKRIVSFVEELQEQGRNGLLKDRTYSAPQKWMRGKGRVTLQFGCCYNYATDKNCNPPGILRNATVDPLPHLFKVMIKRLVRWHVLPSSCVPDSCIVNIYEEGDCIPPHIDNHDFVRPFCTVSLLSECKIVFGSNLKITGPGMFAGSFEIPLPVGSVLVINGNGADIAKHCVPAVPTKRISITFRKMDGSKQPFGYAPDPDLLGLEPLLDVHDKSKKSSGSRNQSSLRKPGFDNEDRLDKEKGFGRRPDARYSGPRRQGPANRRRVQVNLEN